MKKIFLLLLIFPILASSQSKSDYEIYSVVVNQLIDKRCLGADNNAVFDYSHEIDNYFFTYSDFIDSLLISEIERPELWAFPSMPIEGVWSGLQYLGAWKNMKENDPVFDTLPNYPRKDEALALKTSMLSQLRSKQPSVMFVADSFKTFVPVHVLSEIKKNQFAKTKNYWKQFYKLFPQSLGLFTISRIYYSGSLAALFVSHYSGGLSGVAYFIIMRYENENWKTVDSNLLWIS